MASPLYKFPFLYNLFLKLLYGKQLKQKYELISELVGENKKVFELGCGSCLAKDYLKNSCSYTGWDLNPDFINYGRKKGLKVELKNIFDFKDYPESDVILIIDVLHHIVPNHEKLIREARKRSKKVIVAEGWDFYNISKSKGLKKRLYSFINNFVDDDGINGPDNIFKWNYNKKSLINFFKKNKAKEISELGHVLISTF
jgi:SAM-dependent methyltransferase